MSQSVKIEYDRVQAMTDEAFGISIDSECYWLPWSLIEDYSGAQFNDTERYVVIPSWLASKKGLDIYAEELCKTPSTASCRGSCSDRYSP